MGQNNKVVTKKSKTKRGQGDWCYYQRKNGIWEARKQFGKKADGKPNIKALYGKTITEVRSKAKEYENNLSAHKPEVVAKTTVYEYLDNYIKTYKALKVKRTTYDTMEDTLEVRLKPFALASVQMCNLTTELCQNYINELTNCPKKYSRATIEKVYCLLNSCFKHASQVKDIVYNPMELVSLPSEEMVQTPEKEMRFFTFDQVKRVCEQCKKTYKTGKRVYQYGDLIILMMFTGIRIGECIGLTWEDIDLEKDTITINNTVALVKARADKDKKTSNKRVLTNTSPKTKKSLRTIPLSTSAKEALLSIKSRLPSGPKDSIGLSQNGQMTTARNVSRCLESVLRPLGIPDYEEYSLHSLRHTFVSMLLAQGVDIKVISELLGHEKVSTTYNIYAHLMPDDKKKAVSALDDLDKLIESI